MLYNVSVTNISIFLKSIIVSSLSSKFSTCGLVQKQQFQLIMAFLLSSDMERKLTSIDSMPKNYHDRRKCSWAFFTCYTSTILPPSFDSHIVLLNKNQPTNNEKHTVDFIDFSSVVFGFNNSPSESVDAGRAGSIPSSPADQKLKFSDKA